MFTIVLFFNGFEAFIHSFSVSGFFASYITLPVIALSFFGYKVYFKRVGGQPGFTDLMNIDLSHGPVAALAGTRYDLS